MLEGAEICSLGVGTNPHFMLVMLWHNWMAGYDIISILDGRVLVKMGISIDRFDSCIRVRLKGPLFVVGCSTSAGGVRHQDLPDMLPTTVVVCGECLGFGDTHQLQDLGTESVACLLRRPRYLDAPVERVATAAIAQQFLRLHGL